MRIYFITQTDFDINLDIATWKEMSEALVKKGCTVNLILPKFKSAANIYKGKTQITLLPCPRIRFLSFPCFQLSVFFYCLVSAISGKYDLIIADSFSAITLVPLALLKKIGLLKLKIVLDIRSVPVDIYGLNGKIQEKRFNAAVWVAKWLFDGITVITNFYSKKISKDFDIDEKIIGIWTSGVAEEKFSPSIDSDIRKRFGISDKFIVMYHGGIAFSRGIDSLIYAIKALKNEIPDLILMLIGKGNDDEIRSIIKNEGIEDRVIFPGSVPYEEIPTYIKACDVGILPFPDSLWWRMSSPLKLFEYQAMEKPVILTNIESHREAAKDGKFLFLIPSNSVEDISDGIKKAYTMKDMLQALGHDGRKSILRNGTWEVQAQRLINYLKTI